MKRPPEKKKMVRLINAATTVRVRGMQLTSGSMTSPSRLIESPARSHAHREAFTRVGLQIGSS